MTKVRVRFAPSPTGPLHIGGVRTALYNFLFAKKNEGAFILRIEDTDQNRYVNGAEEYIINSLQWLGMNFDEGPGIGGAYGPYRQSERKDIYKSYADELVAKGYAYYAFDSVEELDEVRAEFENDSFKYNFETRDRLKNSLSLGSEDTERLLKAGENIVIRLNIPRDQTITFEDKIRGQVSFSSNELDDKVIMKGDGMPTYHLANIIDDHLMEITHVIRGEEWLSSTAHHVLMYQFFGWQAPIFSHLPLILKPTGQGKLSKRDGAKFGFPVFPLTWNGDENDQEVFPGFREAGFLPSALVNFLAMLGWSSGTDQELFTLPELINAFSLEKIVKSGARFDFDKAKWYNQQYIMKMPIDELRSKLKPTLEKMNFHRDDVYIDKVCTMMKERVETIEEIATKANYLFEKPSTIDQETFDKKYKSENKIHFIAISELLKDNMNRDNCESAVKEYINTNGLKMGEVMPILRISLTGTMQGPDLFDTMTLLGSKEVKERISSILGNKS